jgi:hypothetical protein
LILNRQVIDNLWQIFFNDEESTRSLGALNILNISTYLRSIKFEHDIMPLVAQLHFLFLDTVAE